MREIKGPDYYTEFRIDNSIIPPWGPDDKRIPFIENLIRQKFGDCVYEICTFDKRKDPRQSRFEYQLIKIYSEIPQYRAEKEKARE